MYISCNNFIKYNNIIHWENIELLLHLESNSNSSFFLTLTPNIKSCFV